MSFPYTLPSRKAVSKLERSLKIMMLIRLCCSPEASAVAMSIHGSFSLCRSKQDIKTSI